MVYDIGSVEVVPGKMQDALDWFKRFYGYMKKAYGLQTEWMRAVDPAPGQAYRILFISHYDSLAAWAAHKEKVAKDPERNKLIHEAYEEKPYLVVNTLTISLHNVDQ